jgi:methionyl aminopeptidase
MTIQSAKDLECLRIIGRIVADCLQYMGQKIECGMTTGELDHIGAEFLSHYGARSAPKLTYNFPGTTCISVNHKIAHGIPGEEIINASDMVNIDVSAELDGYFADTGASFIIPPVAKAKERVCCATKEALAQAMGVARANKPLNEIGRAIEKTARRHGLTVIENLASHGVGRALHEEPAAISPYFDPRDKRILHEGLVITIEPFLSNGAKSVREEPDGWTLSTPKNYFSAQYEHTLVITRGCPLVMTTPSKEYAQLIGPTAS